MLYTEPAIVGAAVKACFQPEQRRENTRQKKPSIRQRLKQAQEKKKEQPAQELSKAKKKENSL